MKINGLSDILKIFGIGFIVTMVWQLLEVIFIGEVEPSNVDSIIALILTFSLYLNLKNSEENKKKDKGVEN